MNYQALSSFVILDLPYESRFSKNAPGLPDIELESLKIHNIPLEVLSVGEQVPPNTLQVGDKVLLFLEKDSKVNVIVGEEGKKMILMQFYEIQIRLPREEKEINVKTIIDDKHVNNTKMSFEEFTDLKRRHSEEFINENVAGRV